MTDYFPLLDQPRRPWLDPDELKQAFHTKSLQFHPDAQHGDEPAGPAFAEINEAYQVLQDAKRRIHHLLSLEGRAPERSSAVPADIADLFATVAAATHETDALVSKIEAATAPLSRSLLKPQILQLQNRLAETLQRLRDLHSAAEFELRSMPRASECSAEDWTRLQELYLRFSYLTRWIAELEEKQLRLANT